MLSLGELSCFDEDVDGYFVFIGMGGTIGLTSSCFFSGGPFGMEIDTMGPFFFFFFPKLGMASGREDLSSSSSLSIFMSI